MMRRELFRTTQIFVNGKCFRLEYNLISDRMDSNPVYGLEVIKFSKEREEERCFLPHITSYPHIIHSILNTMSIHSVTPCVTEDVLEDLLQRYA